MIQLTRLNGAFVVVNIDQIQVIEAIPESKIVFANGEYVLVRETPDEIVDKILEFRAKVYGFHKQISIERCD